MNQPRIKLALFKTLSLGLFIFLLSFYVSQSVHCSKTQPYLDDYSTKIVSQTTIIFVNNTVNLEVGIRNPINESISVIVRIHVENVDCFPSNESQVSLPSKNYSPSSEEIDFILIPRQSGTHPLEVQLWWNETKVDYRLLTLDVYTPTPPAPPLEPDVFWAWLRVNGIVWGLVYLIIVIRFVNPSFQIMVEGENAKWLIFFMLSFFYAIGVLGILAFLSQYEIVHSIVSSIGEIQVILGIAWALTVVCVGFALTKKYDWSNRFSTFVVLFLLLSAVWDWLLFPQSPFPTWSPILIIIFGALVQVLLEMGIKGAFKRLKSLMKKERNPVNEGSQ